MLKLTLSFIKRKNKLKIKQDVLDVLIKSTTEENILYLLPTQLDRKLYVDVNKCLESIGGIWNRKLKGHLFDVDPSDLLDDLINTGEYVDKKKEYQFFETPVELAKRLVELAEIKLEDILGEFSAGQGRILDEFPKLNSYVAVELMPDNVKVLQSKGYKVIEGDFLTMSFKVDKVIINPPFNKGQDILHIKHAFECLNSGGRLISIVSESPFFRENLMSKVFRQWLENNNAKVVDLDAGVFKSSGTNVKTRIIILDKN